MCPKTAYKSKTEASEYNKYVGRNKGIWHNIYKCSECGFYHLTTRGKHHNQKLSVYA